MEDNSAFCLLPSTLIRSKFKLKPKVLCISKRRKYIRVTNTPAMFNNGTNKIVTTISTILVVVVIIIPALNGGGI